MSFLTKEDIKKKEKINFIIQEIDIEGKTTLLIVAQSRCQSLKLLEKQLCSNLDIKLSVILTSLPNNIKEMKYKEFKEKFNDSIDIYIQKEEIRRNQKLDKLLDNISTPVSKTKK
jgi:hypothetical protein